jgi:hypothetical protein
MNKFHSERLWLPKHLARFSYQVFIEGLEGVSIDPPLGSVFFPNYPSPVIESQTGELWLAKRRLASWVIEAHFQPIHGWQLDKVYYLDGNPHNCKAENVRCIIRDEHLVTLYDRYKANTPSNGPLIGEADFSAELWHVQSQYYNQREIRNV